MRVRITAVETVHYSTVLDLGDEDIEALQEVVNEVRSGRGHMYELDALCMDFRVDHDSSRIEDAELEVLEVEDGS